MQFSGPGSGNGESLEITRQGITASQICLHHPPSNSTWHDSYGAVTPALNLLGRVLPRRGDAARSWHGVRSACQTGGLTLPQPFNSFDGHHDGAANVVVTKRDAAPTMLPSRHRFSVLGIVPAWMSVSAAWRGVRMLLGSRWTRNSIPDDTVGSYRSLKPDAPRDAAGHNAAAMRRTAARPKQRLPRPAEKGLTYGGLGSDIRGKLHLQSSSAIRNLAIPSVSKPDIAIINYPRSSDCQNAHMG